MKIIYWNTNKNQNINLLCELLQENLPDIFFVSEIDESYLTDNQHLLEGLGYRPFPNPGCERVKIIISIKLTISLGLQNKFFTHVIAEEDLNIISVHFPSQMYNHMDGQKYNLKHFRDKIDNLIGSSNTTPIIVIGDMNVNPYEPAMVNYDGFMASNSNKARQTIKYIEDYRETYYNPTWRLYVESEFPGTKKFPRPSGSSFDIIEFHFLDQVVLSNKFLSKIISDDLGLVKGTANFKFYNKKYNRIDYSDHLPLSYEFKI